MTRNLGQTMVETTPGTVLAGKYRVERVLGTGGMGVVVAALHEQLDERVAIKLLRADRLAQADAVERALREARATVKIQSDHVVRVFDVGTLDNGSPYIVMEYLAGCDLAQLLCAEGKLDIADACSYVRQACDAVAKAHAIGIVHRDLKPANMFLAVRDDKSAIKVLDFGISKFVATDAQRLDPSLTSTASVLGSPAYMSPEQLESPRDIDGRTDVWSLGVILFELLTGAHPFVADTLPQLYKKIADDPAPSVRSIRPDVPVDLDAIVARCLSKRPSERFADVTTLARTLGPFAVDASDERKVAALAETASASREEIESARLASQQVSASAGNGEIVAAPGIAVTGDPDKRSDSTRAIKRRRWAWTGFAFAGVAAAATSTLVCTRADRSPTRAAGGGAAGGAAAAGNPLAKTGSVLACPQLAAAGVDEPSGWLGAAAASIVCTRAQARMGGRAARVVAPAQLLDLPSMPVDGYPEDAFGAAHARERAVANALKRGAAWVDGTITKVADGYEVTLTLRAGDGELARGAGTATSIFEATRQAMKPLEASIPAAPPNDPFVVDMIGATTTDGAVALTDWGIASRFDFGAQITECKAVLAREDVVDAAKAAVRTICGDASSDAQSKPDAVKAAPRDTSSPGRLIMSIEADPRKRDTTDVDHPLLDAALAKETDIEVRAVLLSEKSQSALFGRRYADAEQAALASLHASPGALPIWTQAWDVLSWIRNTGAAAPAAMAWSPWSSEAYCFSATRTTDAELKVQYIRRNVALSTAPVWKEAEVEFLVEAGQREAARAKAAVVGTPGVYVVVDVAEAQFGKALDRAASTKITNNSYDDLVPFQYAAPAAFITGKPLAGVDKMYDHYLKPEVSTLSGSEIAQFSALMMCLAAPKSIGKKCIARLRLHSRGAVGFIEGILEGSEHYVAGRYKDAARTWRKLAAHQGWQRDYLRDFLVEAFERSGDTALATKLDAEYLSRGNRWAGADLVYVREARRAEKRGDFTRARELAKKVIDAWSVADVDVPAVAEMTKLVARVEKRIPPGQAK